MTETDGGTDRDRRFGLAAARPRRAFRRWLVGAGFARAELTGFQLTDAQLTAAGVPPDLVRISVGLEDVEDIVWDLDQALAAATKGS